MRTFHENKLSIFAVFDGHGGTISINLGPEISNYAKKEIYNILIRNANFQRGKFEKALREVFLELDKEMASENGQRKLQEL